MKRTQKIPGSPVGILYVIDGMMRAGGPTVCYNLIRTLERKKYFPVLVTLRYKGALADELERYGVPVFCPGIQRPLNWASMPFQLLRHIPSILSFARKHDVRLVHSHLIASGFYGAVCARILGVPSLLTVHGCLAEGFGIRLVDIAIRNLYRHAVCVCEYVKTEMLRWTWNKSRKCVRVIYNGIDTEYWTATKAVGADGGEQLIQIISVANFSPEKDFDTLLQAYQKLIERHSRLSLVLVGEGPGKEAVARQVRELGLESVAFSGATEDVKRILNGADIYVQSSLTEGFSLSLLQGMSMSLAVVASRVGGTPEMIREGEGILVPARDSQALFEGLDRFAGDVCLRKTSGERARKRIASTFPLQTMVREYDTLYGELVESGR